MLQPGRPIRLKPSATRRASVACTKLCESPCDSNIKAQAMCWHVQELKPEKNETELEVVRSQYANVTALLAVKRKCVLLSWWLPYEPLHVTSTC